MRRTLGGLVAATVVAGGLALATVTPAAAAATDCSRPSWNVVNPHYGQDDRTLVVGLAATTRLLEVRTGAEEGAGACTADSFAIQSTGVFRAEGEFEAAAADESRSGRATARVLVPASDADAGSHNVTATLRDTVGGTSYDHFEDLRNVVVKRHTTLGQAQASPEPAALNQDVFVRAQLRAASWTRDAYVGAGGKSVQLQRRTGSGTYATVATGTTSGSGWASFVTDKGAGTECYRLRYGGSPTLAASVSRGDCVAQAGL